MSCSSRMTTSASSTTSTSTAPSRSNTPNFFVRHPKYYIDGGNLHIVAGGMLFCVHSYFFTRESTTFHLKFYPQAALPGTTGEGLTDVDPVILPNAITAEDFETFLWVFYNPRYSVYDDFSVEQWKVVLRLAQEWDFKQVKELATRELNKLYLLDRLALYEENQVDPRHLVPLYAELCAKNTRPLTLTESTIPSQPQRRAEIKRFFEALALAVSFLILVRAFFWGSDYAFSHVMHRGPSHPHVDPKERDWFSVVPPDQKVMDSSDPRCKLPGIDGPGCPCTPRRVLPFGYPPDISSTRDQKTWTDHGHLDCVNSLGSH